MVKLILSMNKNDFVSMNNHYKSILYALDYLHSKHLIHRCVCPDNIYINQNGHVYLSGLNYCVSLLDQGTLYKKLHDYSTHFHDYLNYLSPEILKQVILNQILFLFYAGFKLNFKLILLEFDWLQYKIRYIQFWCYFM